jgi:hypothetical protein
MLRATRIAAHTYDRLLNLGRFAPLGAPAPHAGEKWRTYAAPDPVRMAIALVLWSAHEFSSRAAVFGRCRAD